ncbi:choice-of-anchor X domain-containing protein [Candidatus Accumulibacter contiguus]|jgi:hypothetical protein|uniref:choice-of-anchor X domain-containing protein n=1 Tax=Candidatus Accumulibacter contiguus TaxID=2954381 RepID=UPI002FC32382
MPSHCQSLLRLGIFPLLARIGIVEAAVVGSLTAPASSASGRAWLARVLALAGLLLPVFSAWAAPSIGSVQITPDAITAGAPTTVRVMAVIADPTLIPATVNLQRVNEAGAAVAVLGSLHDDGRNGDAVAGDQVYTLNVVLTETAALRLRVSAGFQGMVKRVFSSRRSSTCAFRDSTSIGRRSCTTTTTAITIRGWGGICRAIPLGSRGALTRTPTSRATL